MEKILPMTRNKDLHLDSLITYYYYTHWLKIKLSILFTLENKIWILIFIFYFLCYLSVQLIISFKCLLQSEGPVRVRIPNEWLLTLQIQGKGRSQPPLLGWLNKCVHVLHHACSFPHLQFVQLHLPWRWWIARIP